jgi:hypothetical protein
MIGQDGRELFALLQQTPTLTWSRNLPAVETRRRVWVQQFYADGAAARWREATDLPPCSRLICTPFCTPYDPMTPRRAAARSVRRLGRAMTGDDGR